MQHEDGEVFADGLDVYGGIDTVEVEAKLKDVEPVQYGVHWGARVPGCVCMGGGGGKSLVYWKLAH